LNCALKSSENSRDSIQISGLTYRYKPIKDKGLALIPLTPSLKVLLTGLIMEITCPCGGKIKESNHGVKTDRGAREWGVSPDYLPIAIEQSVCMSCGRALCRVFSADGLVIREW